MSNRRVQSIVFPDSAAEELDGDELVALPVLPATASADEQAMALAGLAVRLHDEGRHAVAAGPTRALFGLLASQGARRKAG